MKRILLVIIALYTANISAQLSKKDKPEFEQIGFVKNGAYEVVTLLKSVVNETDCYYFSFKDFKYQLLDESEIFHFCDEGGDLDYLFNEVAKGFSSKESQRFDVADGTVNFLYTAGSVKFFYTDEMGIESESSWITKKKWAALFGRTYNKSDFE